MPFDLNLPSDRKQAGWKVKIRDGERLEEPHVTIMRKTQTWRLSLRSGKFLDKGHQWSQIDREVKNAIETGWDRLKTEWDKKYPNNPIQSDDDDQND